MERYHSVDAMRWIAALMVICIHTLQGNIANMVIIPICRIAVPIFFLISGFFIYQTDHKIMMQKTKKGIKKIFYLVIIANLLYILWDAMIAVAKQDTLSFFTLFEWKNLISFLVLNDSPFAGHLWYLSAYLYVLLLFYLFNRKKERKIWYGIIPILWLVDLIFGKYSIIFWGQEFPYILVRNFLFVGVPYFLLGLLIAKYKNRICSKCKNSMLLLGILVSILGNLAEKWLLVSHHVNATRDQYFMTTVLAILVFLLVVNNPHWGSKRISSLGKKYALLIYLLHPIVIDVLLLITKKLPDKAIYSYFIAFTTLGITCMICHYLIKIICFIKQKEEKQELLT